MLVLPCWSCLSEGSNQVEIPSVGLMLLVEQAVGVGRVDKLVFGFEFPVVIQSSTPVNGCHGLANALNVRNEPNENLRVFGIVEGMAIANQNISLKWSE